MRRLDNKKMRQELQHKASLTELHRPKTKTTVISLVLLKSYFCSTFLLIQIYSTYYTRGHFCG